MTLLKILLIHLKNGWRDEIMEMWITRERSGLWIYSEKPTKYEDTFGLSSVNDKVYELDSDLFPEITFENSPKRIKIELMEE